MGSAGFQPARCYCWHDLARNIKGMARQQPEHGHTFAQAIHSRALAMSETWDANLRSTSVETVEQL